MKIWMFNDYGALPSQSTITRHYFFAQELQKMGHEPAVFVGSHPHNTDLQMITGKEKFRLEPSTPFPWVYVKTKNYEGSKLKRVFSMFEYYRNAKKAALAMAKETGCTAFNGFSMLLWQGAGAFQIWTGREMPMEPLRNYLRQKKIYS